MHTAARIWRQIGPRIYGLALIIKVGIPLLVVLSLAVGGYTAFSKISAEVRQFEENVQAQISQIKEDAKAIQKPIADFNRQFGRTMSALKPVVTAINKIGDIWPISKLHLNFLRLPAFPNLGPVLERTRSLKRAAFALQATLEKMSTQVRQTYAKVEAFATIVSSLFLLWVMALFVVFGARWTLEFVQGWKLLVHGAVSAPKEDSAHLQAQIEALRTEIDRQKIAGQAGSNRQAWLALLALLVLSVYVWNAQDRLLNLVREEPVAPQPPVEVSIPETPDPEEPAPLVELDGELLFGAGSTAISAYGRRALRRLVPELLIELEQAPERVLVVGGHTDDAPIRRSSFTSNQALSLERARVVTHILLEEGLPAERVVAIGFGANQPRIPNEDAVSRHLNRRVELSLVPRTLLEGA